MPLFLSWEDTRRMLDHTVVSYDGRLTYVTRTTPDLTSHMVDAETGERFTAMADFHKIGNPKAGRLGYVNVQGIDALYVVRFSARVFKAGYSMDNLLTLRKGATNRFDGAYFGAMLEGLHYAYINEYPSFEAAYKQAKETQKTVAYDRSFAIMKDGKVLYQSHVVGTAPDANEENIVWTKKGLLASFVRARPKLNWGN